MTPTCRTVAALLSVGMVLTAATGPTGSAPAADAAPAVESVAAASGPAAVQPRRQRLSNGCWATRRGKPRCGAYLGMAYGANSDPSRLERRVGRLGIRRTYYRADQVRSAARTARVDAAAGRLPWISFKMPHPWWRMARGKGDAWARKVARVLSNVDGPVWVAFHHEPEGDGYIPNWRKTQQRLGPIVRRSARNVAFTVILTGWHQLYGSKAYSFRRTWPRGIKVDVAGFDVYNAHGMVKRGERLGPTDMDGDYFRRIARWAAKRGVRWGLAETGYTDYAARRDPQWIDRTHGELVARGGVAMAYFNSTLNSTASWDLSLWIKRRAFADALVGTPKLPAS